MTGEGIERDLEHLPSIPDPVERARRAQELVDHAKRLRRKAAVLRYEAVRELRGIRDAEHPEGFSHQEIADMLGVARGVAQYVAEGRGLGRDPEGS